MPKNLGFDITTHSDLREDAFLFGESPSRVVVTIAETDEDNFLDMLSGGDLPFLLLGHVTKHQLRIDDSVYGTTSEFKKIYNTSLASKLLK